MAIHKVHARGGGGGAGPVDYLLGKDREREGAKLLRGDPEQMIELVDSLKFAQRYTSGVISFAERDIPEQHKQEIMDGLEKTLLPGLDADQYSVMWVEHTDKGRLELNYVFANVELDSGKRLAPYYDKADRKRVQAWMETVRHDYELADPNAPERRRALSTPADLPRDKKQAAEVITAGLMEQMKTGTIKDRADVVQALESAGFEVARQVKGSISIKDPSGGKNLRLTGAIYERDFKFSGSLSTEIRKAGREYRAGSSERVQAARRDYQAMLERKREYLAGRYYREPQAPEGPDIKGLDVAGTVRLDVADVGNVGPVRDRGNRDQEHTDHSRAEPHPETVERGAGAASMEGGRPLDAGAAEGLAGATDGNQQRGETPDFLGYQKSTGEITDEQHRDTGGFAESIRRIAGAARRTGADVAARAKAAVQTLLDTVGRLNDTLGRFDRAAAIQRNADREHSESGQGLDRAAERLGGLAGTLEQSIKTLEQPKQPEVRQMSRSHFAFSGGGRSGPDRGGMSM